MKSIIRQSLAFTILCWVTGAAAATEPVRLPPNIETVLAMLSPTEVKQSNCPERRAVAATCTASGVECKKNSDCCTKECVEPPGICR